MPDQVHRPQPGRRLWQDRTRCDFCERIGVTVTWWWHDSPHACAPCVAAILRCLGLIFGDAEEFGDRVFQRVLQESHGASGL